MNNAVFISPAFKRDAKPLAKKYHTLKTSIDILIENLKVDPYLGENYGNGVFKVRLADPSKGKGQRGGFRILYYHLKVNKNGIQVLLLTIYNKSEVSTIKKSEALKKLKRILAEYENENL
jgi:mRNA-degrading endonuclease RelE of RelBE toxin-antitoxin system